MSCDHNSLSPFVQNTLVGKPECSTTLYDCLQQVWMTVTALHRMGRVNTPVLYVLEGPISGDCVQGQETDDAVYPMVRCLIFGIRYLNSIKCMDGKHDINFFYIQSYCVESNRNVKHLPSMPLIHWILLHVL